MSDILVDALATYRLTRLLQRDTHPSLRRLRDAVRATKNEHLIELMECPWCLGLWVGAAVSAARLLLPRAWRPAAQALACSAVAGLLLRYVDIEREL